MADGHHHTEGRVNPSVAGHASSSSSTTAQEGDPAWAMEQRAEDIEATYLAPYIARMCMVNGIDVSRVTQKRDRARLLADIPPEQLVMPPPLGHGASGRVSFSRQQPRMDHEEVVAHTGSVHHEDHLGPQLPPSRGPRDKVQGEQQPPRGHSSSGGHDLDGESSNLSTSVDEVQFRGVRNVASSRQHARRQSRDRESRNSDGSRNGKQSVRPRDRRYGGGQHSISSSDEDARSPGSSFRSLGRRQHRMSGSSASSGDAKFRGMRNGDHSQRNARMECGNRSSHVRHAFQRHSCGDSSRTGSDREARVYSQQQSGADSALLLQLVQQQQMMLTAMQEQMQQQSAQFTATLRELTSRPPSVSSGVSSSSGGLRKIHGLSKMTKDCDIVCYMQTFETMMRTHDVDRSQWYLYLCSVLADKAETAFYSLPDEDRKDYDKVYQAIMEQYGCTSEVYRRKFFDLKRSEGQSHVDHGARLMRYFRRWVGEGASKEDVINTVVGNQLIWSLKDRHLQQELRKLGKGKTPRQVAQLADELAAMGVSSQDASTGERRSGKSLPDHQFHRKERKDAPQEHQQRRSEGQLRCWRCDSTNHLSKECPQNKQPRSPPKHRTTSKVNRLAVVPDSPGSEASVEVRDTDMT